MGSYFKDLARSEQSLEQLVPSSPPRNTDIAFSSTPILATRPSTRRSQLVMFLIFVAFSALVLRAFWRLGGNRFVLVNSAIP